MTDTEKLEWIWANCKVVHFPKKDAAYPIEHAPHANKDSRKMIEAQMPDSSPSSSCSAIPRICRWFGHKWEGRDGRSKVDYHQHCLRCGIHRDYFGTLGYGSHTAPYWSNVQIDTSHTS